MCAGMGGGSGMFLRRRTKYKTSAPTIASTASTTAAMMIQSHGLGIANGGLMSRSASGRTGVLEETFVMRSLASQSPAFARLEKFSEDHGVRLVGAQLD